jgi:hypothetical protein
MLPILLSLWLLAQNTSTLHGQVLRASSSEPVGDVEISLVSPNINVRPRTVTNGQGSFSFDDLPAGKYSVQARREGYFTEQGNPLPNFVATVTLEPLRSQQIVVTLIPGAIISGRATDTEGQPMVGVEMSAMKLQYDEGRPVFSVGTPPIATNARGEYRIPWLPPGEYYLRAEFPSPRQQFAMRTYYPGTTDSLAAITLTIRGGESLDGTNLIIPTVPMVRLSGEILTEGRPVAVRTFYLLPQDGRPQESYPFELKNLLSLTPGFVLEARGIPPGSYELAPFFVGENATYHTGRTHVEIGQDNVENIAAIVNPNVDVKGKILVAEGGAIPAFPSLQLRARDATVPLMSRSATAQISPDGSFVIPNVTAGRYYVYFSVPSRGNASSWYVSGLRLGSVDIRNDGVIDIQGVASPLEITLSSGAGTIRGVVDAAGGQLPPHADVVLVPQFSRRANPLFYDRTGMDADGSFNFEGVAPGEYKVFAFEQLQATAEQNPSFIARYETLGQSVTVNSGSSTEVRARLLR